MELAGEATSEFIHAKAAKLMRKERKGSCAFSLRTLREMHRPQNG